MQKSIILVIDDDPTQHIILRNYLKAAGYEVIHAEDGEQGLKIFDAKKPDLVLLDVQMPGLDGFQVLEKIKKNDDNKHVAVLLLTALDYQHLKIQGLEFGADDYITKPFNKAELLARISAVLRRSDRGRRREGAMEGDLADVGVSDLLQSMELGIKTATIRIRDIDAEIVVKNGKLLYARQGISTGDQALLRIFLIEQGYFSVVFNEIPPYISEKPRSLTSILMNISNEVDDVFEIMRQMGVKDRRLQIKGDISEYPELEKISEILPASFIQIITAMNGTIKDNIKTLIDASQKRVLKVEQK
ncbi:response regulator [Desulfobacterales bacterium HSG17]|nr:response regulator [Desulfobacterales bacterium HSG17]